MPRVALGGSGQHHGAVGTACVGMWLFQEPATAARLVCIGLIVAGIIGLKLAS